jgi:hypothetical protein
MDRLQSSRRTRARVPASIQDVSAIVMRGLIQQRLDTRLREAPSSGIQRLFLCPDNILSIGIAVEILFDLRPRERMQLLDTSYGSLFVLELATMACEIHIHLARAEDDALNVLARVNLTSFMTWVFNDPLKVRLARECTNVGARERMTQQRLAEEQDKRCLNG